MRKLAAIAAIAAGLAVAPAAALEPELRPGETLDARIDGDLDGDGSADLAYLVSTEDHRELIVALTDGATESLAHEPTPLGPGSLAIDGNVLEFEDLTGGTTAIASTRRFRFDGLRNRMRLIGLDATVYSRTNAHDGFEASWNLINGDAITRELKLVEGAGEDAYADGRQRRFKQRVRPRWLAESPDPETMLEEMCQD